MAASDVSGARVSVDGKFFRLGAAKFYLKGVTYGPFAPNAQKEPFGRPEQAERDFKLIRELGANTVRVYHVPPRWLLDLAARHELKVLIGIAWPWRLCFLDSEPSRQQAREAVRRAVEDCRAHPAVLAYCVANEIPAEIVRWSGVHEVEAFLDELVKVAKSVDPDGLCTFANFPPTEFLRPQNIDFVCFNVYLHERKAYESYLARLQMLANAKPLVLTEFGMDSLREGEARKCDFLAWQIELAFRGGLAGTVVFSFSDDWAVDGVPVKDWAFGLTTPDRDPKDSFRTVQASYASAPYFPLPRWPKVSVVVACYNGERTLNACLASLGRLNYPDYEVILVDDGSTDDTRNIAGQFQNVRLIRQEHLGLSVARNAGIAAATGEIVAFTDADCRADADWLYYLVGDLLKSDFAGIGGHNFLPPEDSLVATAVMVSPGGPSHVMLSDREAEHIPGCNMAFYRWALEEIGGFDRLFQTAGDDVDICWRLQHRGHQIGFSPGGFVWHYRRSTVRSYLRQQSGYGEAEALLSHKHPEYFNSIGRGIWRGRIYGASQHGVVLERSIIYHGLFGSSLFQKLYAPAPSLGPMLFTSLEYHVLVTIPLLVLSMAFRWLLPVAVTSLGISLAVCCIAAAQAPLPEAKRRFWSRPLVALLFLLQPIERGLARYRTRLYVQTRARPRQVSVPAGRAPSGVLSYWSAGAVDRYALLSAIQAKLEEEGWQVRSDSGWVDYDLEIMGSRWSRLRLTTVAEDLEQSRRGLRCRLEPSWSLLAKVLFWFVLGLELILIGLLADVQPWIWAWLLTMPLINWFLDHERLSLQASIAAVVDEVSTRLNLVKLPTDKSASRSS